MGNCCDIAGGGGGTSLGGAWGLLAMLVGGGPIGGPGGI